MADEKNETDDVVQNILVPFNPLEAEIARLTKLNRELAFDYRDPKQNKEARSHVFLLRQLKSQIATIHKQAKEVPLKITRAIDAKKNELTDRVEIEIAVHAEPLAAIEKEEADRLAAEQRKLLEERAEAERIRLADMQRRENEIAVARKRLEDEERERLAVIKQREDAVAAQQAKLDRDEQERRNIKLAEERTIAESERKIKEAEEKHRQELQDAENKRIADLKAAEQKAIQERAAKESEQKRLAEIESRRQANVKHRAKVNAEVLSIFTDCGMQKKTAEQLVLDLSKDLYPALKIIY